MKNTEEIWRDVIEFEGYYQVSNLGNVRSLDRIIIDGRLKKGKEIKQSFDQKGYKIVGLSKFPIRKNLKVHRLVCLSFLENPMNKPEVNHINGIKHDNFVENLEWCTRKENVIHSWASGFCGKTFCIGKHNKGKTSAKGRLVLNLETGIYYLSVSEAARAMRIPIPTMIDRMSGKIVNRTSLVYC